MADWKIRSYVLRSVKLPVTYRKVLEEFGSRYCVPFCGNGVRFEEIFGNNRQVFAEIGFGAGDFLFSTAVRRSFDNFIGLEVFLQGLGKLVYRLHEKGITNVRVINEDAALVFAGMIPAESLSGIHIMFPDPWPKKKHKKRRLLTAEFASLLLASLVPGGYIWIATDWVDYAGQIAEIFLSFPVTRVPLESLDRDTFERFPGKYEEKAGSAGREVHEFFYRKNR